MEIKIEHGKYVVRKRGVGKDAAGREFHGWATLGVYRTNAQAQEALKQFAAEDGVDVADRSPGVEQVVDLSEPVAKDLEANVATDELLNEPVEVEVSEQTA